MIKERYCSYEVAKLLKEKGFDEACTCLYYNGDLEFVNDNAYEHVMRNSSIANKDFITAPTHQMACDWLREVHKIFADPIKQGNYNDTREDYTYIVASNGTIYRNSSVCDKYSYEEAIEAALKYSLENLV